jgi:transposase
LLRGKDVQEIIEMKREGLSTRAISKLTGYDRKTIRKYLRTPETAPGYGPRSPAPSKLDPHKAYLEDPRTALLSDHVKANESVILSPAKTFFRRPRPYQARIAFTRPAAGWPPVLVPE